MNFLDAHRIVHDYSKPFASGSQRPNAMLRIPLSSLPVTVRGVEKRDVWKDTVIQAHQIFFSHMVLWTTRTPDQMEQYLFLLSQINSFVDDEVVAEIEENFRLIQKEKSLYGRLHKDKVQRAKKAFFDIEPMPGSYRYDDVVNVINEMQTYKTSEFLPRYEQSKGSGWDVSFDSLLADYCRTAYQVSHIPFKDEYVDYFWSFDILRRFVDDAKYAHLFRGYERYIRENQ